MSISSEAGSSFWYSARYSTVGTRGLVHDVDEGEVAFETTKTDDDYCKASRSSETAPGGGGCTTPWAFLNRTPASIHSSDAVTKNTYNCGIDSVPSC